MARTTFSFSVKSFLVLLASTLFVAVLIRTAWISDDAYITYRAVENFVLGHGMNINPGHRVQAYTHPLWAFLHVPCRMLFSNMYGIGIFLSVLTTLGAVAILLFRLRLSHEGKIFLLAALLSSAAYMDYSTSGLENPLTNLLLACFVGVFLSKGEKPVNLMALSFLTGLMLLNRMDSVLLVLPLMAYEWWKLRGLRSTGQVVVGLLPFLLWECGATIYYGFPFPTTAYAKLNSSMGLWDRLAQGMYYIEDFLRHDPLSFLLVMAGMLVPLLIKKRELLGCSLGIFLYVLYILYIGGDFMQGRFFCSPVFLSCILLSQVLTPQLSVRLAPIVFLLGFWTNFPPILSHSNLGASMQKERFIGKHGIANERVFYFPSTGLIAAKGRSLPDSEWVKVGKEVRASGRPYHLTGPLGFQGYFAGPEVHVVDWYGLSDPFLAQLPNQYRPSWRPGHNQRLIPAGYINSLVEEKNLLVDPDLSQLYRAIQLVTEGPLWTRERFREIWKLNMGTYRNQIDRDFFFLPIRASFSAEEAMARSAKGIIIRQDAGFEIDISPGRQIEEISMRLRDNCTYALVFRQGEQIISGREISKQEDDQDMSLIKLDGPKEVIDNILIYPLDQLYSCPLADIMIK